MSVGFRPISLVVAACVVAGCHAQPHDAPAATATAAPSISSSPPAAPGPPSTDPYRDSPLIDHVEWVSNDQGRRLQVVPTRAGRDDPFLPAWERAWSEVVALAPDADTPGMRNQFLCHWASARLLGADKPSWNLEPWRPEVGYQATVAAACNPGGPEN